MRFEGKKRVKVMKVEIRREGSCQRRKSSRKSHKHLHGYFLSSLSWEKRGRGLLSCSKEQEERAFGSKSIMRHETRGKKRKEQVVEAEE